MDATDRFYRIQFKNVGGLVMPVILLVTLEDGSTQEIRIPAEVWRMDTNQCDTLVVTEQPIVKFELDPYRETADVNRDNNHFPPVIEPSRFQLFKGQRRSSDDNPMAKAKRAAEAAKKAKEAEEQKEKVSQEPSEPSEKKNSAEDTTKSIDPEKKVDSDKKAETDKKKEKKEKKAKKRSLMNV